MHNSLNPNKISSEHSSEDLNPAATTTMTSSVDEKAGKMDKLKLVG